MANADLAQYIDHTLLKADANLAAIEKLCQEARTFGFWSVCVNPCWIEACRTLLAGSPVKICTVVGFPLGAQLTLSKVFEAKAAITMGADELDMVINVGFVKSALWSQVMIDLAAVVAAAPDHLVKVILETGLLNEEEKRQACAAAISAGAAFVKTSTGFGPGGATVADIQLMKEAVGEKLKIKASGGVRDLKTMQEMIKAGASRIGTSSAVDFLQGQRSTENY